MTPTSEATSSMIRIAQEKKSWEPNQTANVDTINPKTSYNPILTDSDIATSHVSTTKRINDITTTTTTTTTIMTSANDDIEYDNFHGNEFSVCDFLKPTRYTTNQMIENDHEFSDSNSNLDDPGDKPIIYSNDSVSFKQSRSRI